MLSVMSDLNASTQASTGTKQKPTFKEISQQLENKVPKEEKGKRVSKEEKEKSEKRGVAGFVLSSVDKSIENVMERFHAHEFLNEEEMYDELEKDLPDVAESSQRSEKKGVEKTSTSKATFAKETEFVQKDSVFIQDLISSRTYKKDDKKSLLVTQLIDFAEQVCSIMNIGTVACNVFKGLSNISVNDVTKKVSMRAFLMLMKIHFIFMAAGFHGLIFYDAKRKNGIYINPSWENSIPSEISREVEDHLVGLLSLITCVMEGATFFTKNEVLIFKAIINHRYRKHITSILLDIFKVRHNPALLERITFAEFKKYFEPICNKPIRTHIVPSMTSPKPERKSASQSVPLRRSEEPAKRSEESLTCDITTIDKLSRKCTNDPLIIHFTRSNELFFIPMMMCETSNLEDTYAMFDEVRRFEQSHPLISDELRSLKKTNVIYDIIINSYLLIFYIIMGNLRHSLLPEAEITHKWWNLLHQNTKIWISKEYLNLAKMMFESQHVMKKISNAEMAKSLVGEKREMIISPCNSNLHMLAWHYSDDVEIVKPSREISE